MIKILTKLLIIVLFVGLGMATPALSQSSYPVTVSPPLLTTPYTLNLSDYCAMGSQKLMVNLYASDLEISRLPVKLQLKIESVGITIENLPTIVTTPIYLDGGSTILLYGDDLADYFNLNNLNFKGITKEAYQRAGQLPEGFYKFSITVLHFNTNRVVSNVGVNNAWIVVGKPPTLKFPQNDAYLGETPGMPLTFSWLAGNAGSPAAFGGIQYNFQMWELRINSVNPNIVASTVPVFYEQTTFGSIYTFYPATVMMEPGMRYAWRVTAFDPVGSVAFEQKGQSEIRTFTYKAACDSVSNLASRTAGRSGHFTWDVGPMHTSYNVEMRNPATAWSKNSETYENKASFFGLEYGSVYEMRVQSVCNSDPTSVSDFTQWQSLKITVPEPAYDTVSCPNCGCDDANAEVTLTNFTQSKNLAVGDTIANKRGTTRLIIKQIKTENNGTYEGVCYFWAEIWGLKIPCNFWNLQVNTDNVFINLELESINDPAFLLDVNAALDGLNDLADNLNILFEDQPIDTFNIEGVIDYMYVNEDNEVIAVEVKDDGTIEERKIGDEKDLEKILLKDEEGREYVVTKKGDVMGAKEYADTDGGKKGEVSDRKDKIEDEAAETPSVAFTAVQDQKYGFDEYTEVKASIQNQYPVLKGDYRPAFKSIAGYSPDAVAISGYNQHTLFKDDMGIPATQQDNKLILLGGPHESEKALYAFDTLAKPEQVIGKLNLKSYTPETFKLVMVSVNGATLPDSAELSKTLNAIYKQSVVKWEVVKGFALTDISFEADKMSHGGSGGLTPYNTDQKTLVNTYDDTYELEDEARYLFFISEVVDKDANIAGYMPLKYQCGFIYGMPNNNTIAHELGHGTFNLYHTFAKDNNISPEGTTQNLMDYAGGTELWHYQWDLIHDPESMAFAFLIDEKESQAVDKTVNYFLSEYRKNYQIIRSDVLITPIILSSEPIVLDKYNYQKIDIKVINNSSNNKFASVDFNKLSKFSSNSGIILGVKSATTNYIEITCNEMDIDHLINYFEPSHIIPPVGLNKKNGLIVFISGHEPANLVSPDLGVYETDYKDYWEGFDDRMISRINLKNVRYIYGHRTAHIEPSEGFRIRKGDGKITGKQLASELPMFLDKTLPITIVCHSMGFAHALGLIDNIKEYNIEAFYIIAPLSPSLGYIPENIADVWHYGCLEDQSGANNADWIAPQDNIPGGEQKRLQPPKNWEKGAIDCHVISNQFWILGIPEKEKGYVKTH